jgi:hypothetical protein
VSQSDIVNILIAVVVLGYVLYRQTQARPIRDNVRLPIILAIIGAVELVQFLDKHHGTRTVAALGGSLVLAAAFGAIRAATTKVWIEGGQAWRRGGWLTAVLWVVSLAAHLGYDYLLDGKGPQSGLGSASLLLYLAITLLIQGLILLARASRLPGGAEAGLGLGSSLGFGPGRGPRPGQGPGPGGGFGSGPDYRSSRHYEHEQRHSEHERRREARRSYRRGGYPPPDANYPPPDADYPRRDSSS